MLAANGPFKTRTGGTVWAHPTTPPGLLLENQLGHCKQICRQVRLASLAIGDIGQGRTGDAALQTGGAVTVGWTREGRGFELWIDDEGSGLTNASNLFVPFFTTKPGGLGIGLVLSRQIAEAHGGTLTLDNRTDRRGCRAYLRLPV